MTEVLSTSACKVHPIVHIVSCIRFLYTSFWAETRVETNTRNKKLVFSSFVSPISRTFYEFRKHKTPKLVFYPTYKEWPK